MDQIAGVSLQQTLSPQMRQSLEILQAPVAELSLLVRQELEVNPVLEEERVETEESDAESDADFDREFEELSRMDDEWREYFSQSAAGHHTSETEERRQRLFDSLTERPTLQSFLLEQAATAGFSETDLRLANALIGNVDDTGFYRGTDSEVAWLCGVTEEEVARVLATVQQFDPPGVMARSLGECLALQLDRQGHGETLARRIVDQYLPELARRKFPEIARKLGVHVADVQKAAELIAHLDPQPGRQYAGDPEQVVVADVFVERTLDGWSVHLNDRDIPHLRISNYYKDLMSTPGSGREVRDYIRDKIKGGKFFIRSIQQRQQTILQIANEIVQRQPEFFSQGPSGLKPMTMSQVADAVGVHETTVSRAVSGKYMETPFGMFELRFFFTTGFQTSGGASVSNESVKDAVSSLVASEGTRNPLSDQQIVEILSERGIPIARRTVAKYRDQLGILPSHLRRKFS